MHILAMPVTRERTAKADRGKKKKDQGDIITICIYLCFFQNVCAAVSKAILSLNHPKPV